MDDQDSDFGYDFSPDEEQLLLQLASNGPPLLQTASSLDENKTDTLIDALPAKADPITEANQASSHAENVTSAPDFVSTTALGETTADAITHSLSLSVPSCGQVSYPDLSRALEPAEESPASEVQSKDDYKEELDDGRSPLQKFRSFPRRPLTVSDLTSGAWCELQYWYTLSRLPGGRRTRTAAMKQGSKVHQKLEDEVHTTVEVEVLSKEDGFGLRLWNFIQGMRTLRETGLTRELEVWGLVDGNLVNGVIDSLSHQHPNPEFEVELSQEADEENQQQKKVTDFFQSKSPPKKTQNSPKIYLADVKTRGSLKQVSNVALRPAKIQLLLYHRFLGDIAAGRLDFYKVFRRYGLDPDEPFSDTFIAQMSNMHEEMFDNEPSSSTDSAYTDTADQQPSSADETDALNYRSLRELLPLVKEEVKLALPEDADSLGNMLRVLYIYRDDGREIGHYDFPVSNIVLDDYLSTYMEWWKGERKAVGVDIEEAFKCRTCEFAEVCTWRQNMDDERVRKVQQRLRAAQS